MRAAILPQPAVGTRSEAHLDEALADADLRLSVDQLAWLEQGGPAAGVTPRRPLEVVRRS
jgi:hypothetical protein